MRDTATLVLHGLTLRQLATAEQLGDILGLEAPQITEHLETAIADGHALAARGAHMITPGGRELLDGRYPEDFAAFRADTTLGETLESFEFGINKQMLALMTSWQTITVPDGSAGSGGAQQPNDHSDADYDAKVIDRLAALHDRAVTQLAPFADADPLVKRFLGRLDEAMQRVDRGEHDYVSNVRLDSYLNADAVLAAALGAGCDAIHPGYGFLSENPVFARRCVEEGLRFIGPNPTIVAGTGDKAEARRIAREAGVPVLSGSDVTDNSDAAVAAAERIGYPVLIKAVAGGGGRGMSVVQHERELRDRLPTAIAEATAAFGDGRIYVERFIANARHIEVQVIGDRHGTVVHVGERDCSAQRRHQKVIEESPAPGLSEQTRTRILDAAVHFAEAIDLDSAGTVEFVYDADTDTFAFLEFNARIQVEHPVSEPVSGIDLVAEQIRVAAGLPLSFSADEVHISGHAIEARVMAESPERGFVPVPGTVTRWLPPSGIGIRVDSHCRSGTVISPHYDSMIAKIIAHAPTREQAIDRLVAALDELVVDGLPTTFGFSTFLLQSPAFRDVAVTTRWIDRVGADDYRSDLEETR